MRANERTHNCGAQMRAPSRVVSSEFTKPLCLAVTQERPLMKHIFTLVATCLVGGAFPANLLAATWVPVAGNASMAAEVDRDSMRRAGPKVKVWVRWLYQESTDVKDAYPKLTFQSLKSLAIYNCVDKTNINLQEVFYADRDGGEVVKTNVVPETTAGYDEVVPDSMGEAILRFACDETARKRK